ncbi:MAG: Uma2 family endonuclease [Lachnospiraceae bacterium]|nr:Uma2 family endonuclease [Lachnospiraceae bacterium]
MGEKFVYDLNEIEGKHNVDRVMEPALAYRCDGLGDKTLEDYLALPEGTRVELIDGVFYDMATPTGLHQRLILKIAKVLDDFVEKNGGKCITLMAPFDVQLFHDNKTCVQPDILVLCDREQLRSNSLDGAPDLVVEVASPSNWRMDALIKRQKYFEAGVREYWIVFPEDKRILVYRFEAREGQDCPVPAEYTFADKVPVGIWDGACRVNFAEIYEAVRFLYEKEQELSKKDEGDYNGRKLHI